jgi:hypothetical protein
MQVEEGEPKEPAWSDAEVDVDRRRSHGRTRDEGRFGRAETILIDEVLYERGGLTRELLSRAGLPSGWEERWIRKSVPDEAGASWSEAAAGDVFGAVGLLRLTTEPEDLGQESVRGVRTTRYRSQPSVGQIRRDPSGRRFLGALLGALDAKGSSRVRTEAWVDQEGYVRRLRLVVPAPHVRTMTLTFELFAFNEPVEIEPPDPSQVIDPKDLPGGN